MLTDVEELDLISAIWIMASNDENHLMTYKSIRYRLGLADDFNVEALIRRRPELFRLGANQNDLDAWKVKMLDDQKLPSWIRKISDLEIKKQTILSLTVHDLFRSQFRATTKAGERSPIEIIKWGLEHLDRIRKARSEAKDVNVKASQVWLVFFVALLGLLVQIGAIIFSIYFRTGTQK